MLSYTSDRKKVSLLLRSTGALAWLDFTAKLSNIWIPLRDQSGHSSSHLNIYTTMTLDTGFLYQVAVDVRSFQCRFSICGLTKRVTGNQPAPTAVLFSFFKEAHLFFFRCESASDWTPVFKSVRESAVAASEQIFHHCLHKFFFPNLMIVLAAVFTKLALESEMQL